MIKESKAAQDVINERNRQITGEGYSTDNDDAYSKNELLRASSSYLNHAISRGWVYKETLPEAYTDECAPSFFPFNEAYWKPKNPRADLIRAAALIIAEIERLDRQASEVSE